MTPKIVLLNGPPGCGKDTVANILANQSPSATVVKFATPLKTVAKHLYCHGDDKLFAQMDSPKEKDIDRDLFFGKSCRQVQIDISEEYAKPMHGENVFGKILASTIAFKMEKGYDTFFVSDSGFRPEAIELINQFGVECITLIRLHRDGKTFEGDSRNYISLDDHNVVAHDLHNPEGNVEELVTQINNIINKENN